MGRLGLEGDWESWGSLSEDPWQVRGEASTARSAGPEDRGGLSENLGWWEGVARRVST